MDDGFFDKHQLLGFLFDFDYELEQKLWDNLEKGKRFTPEQIIKFSYDIWD